MDTTKVTYYPKGTRVRCLKDGKGNGFTKGKVYVVRADFEGDLTANPWNALKVEQDDHGSHSNGWCAGYFEKDSSAPAPTVLGTQVGGSHYTDCSIQPIEYIWANKLGFSEGNVVKYITRWRSKGGIKDLEKARHHISLLIEHAQNTGLK